MILATEEVITATLKKYPNHYKSDLDHQEVITTTLKAVWATTEVILATNKLVSATEQVI